MNATKGTNLALSKLELKVLEMAAQSIGEDINEYGLTPQEKAAYHRVLRKVQQARRAFR